MIRLRAVGMSNWAPKKSQHDWRALLQLSENRILLLFCQSKMSNILGKVEKCIIKPRNDSIKIF
jgi:hypothetical protein